MSIIRLNRTAVAGAGLLFALLFVGCERDGVDQGSEGTAPAVTTDQTGETKVAKPKKPVAVIDSLSPTSVVIRVNGEEITKAEFVAWERARTKTWAMTRGWKPDTSNDDTKKFIRNSRVRALGELVKNALIAQYAKAEGIEPEEKDVLTHKRKFLRRVKKPKSSFEDVVASMGAAEGEMLGRMLLGDAVTMAVLEHCSSNDLHTVSAQELTNRLEFVREWNQRADETNAIVRARAAKAKEEILAGAYFADVAKKYADFLPEQGEKWNTFYLDEFEGDDPLGQWLARAEPGDISDPIDLEDGISIVGLVAKLESPLSVSNKPPVYAYEVVRCPFYAYERQEDFGDNEKAIIEDILERRRQLAMRELHDRLVESAKIEFPCGNNLFYPQGEKKKPKAKKKKTASAAKSAAKDVSKEESAESKGEK